MQGDSALELSGIERVDPSDRTDTHSFDNLTVWLSANTVVSSVALGSLAVPLFHLGWWDSLAAILLFNVLGVLPVAFLATLGPLLGLRQMTISRFAFGWNAARLLAFFNVVACVGWSAVNSIVGGEILASATSENLPVWAGILLLAAITTPVSMFGYRFVHRFERFAWAPMSLIFLWMGGVAAGSWQAPPSAPLNLAAFLSFGSAVYGFATSWSSYASDYNVRQPENTPPRRVFWLTLAGILLPCLLLETLGLALTLVPRLQGKMGGALLAETLLPMGAAGQAALFLLALSVVSNNIPNDYSLGLSLQVLGRWWQRVPRHIWTVVGAVVYVALAIPAAAHFGETLTDFLLIMGYWLGPWCTVMVLDYFCYRMPAVNHERTRAYEVDAWDDPSRLPARWPAILAMALGLLGAALGAHQALWSGPLSHGADVGFEVAVAVTAVAYVALRKLFEVRAAGPGA